MSEQQLELDLENRLLKISYVRGDIAEMIKNKEVDAVIHGCNCYHTMGAGIAKQLNDLTGGGLLEVDKTSPFGDINKLGKFTRYVHSNGVKIYNLYSQFNYGTNGKEVLVHWDSVFNGICSVIEDSDGVKIALPYIGCGLAGGLEEDLISVLKDIESMALYDNVELVLVEYSK